MLAFYMSLVDTPIQRRVLEEIYQNYSKQMFLMAKSILKNDEDAEDIVHDVFLAIAKHRIDTVCQITNANDLRNYLLKATKNASLNVLRKRKKTVVMSETEISALGEKNTELLDDAVWEQICCRAEAEQVVKVIQALPDTYRWAIYCYFVLELTLSQTAVATEQSVSATKKQLYRGKKLLLEALAATGGDER